MDYQGEFTGPQIDERLRLAETAYQRPENGIPMEDLDDDVQEKLSVVILYENQIAFDIVEDLVSQGKTVFLRTTISIEDEPVSITAPLIYGIPNVGFVFAGIVGYPFDQEFLISGAPFIVGFTLNREDVLSPADITRLATREQYNGILTTLTTQYTKSEDIPFEKGAGTKSAILKGSGSAATGTRSVAMGYECQAKANNSNAEGHRTMTTNAAEHAEGRYNVSNNASDSFGDAGNTLHSVGIGRNADAKKNAEETMQNGLKFIAGVNGYDGTNPTREHSIQAAFETLGIPVDWTALGY